MKCLTSLFLLLGIALFTTGCAEQPATAPIDDATTTAPDGTMDEGVVTDEYTADEPATVVDEPVYSDEPAPSFDEPAPSFDEPAPVTEPAPEPEVKLDPAVDPATDEE